MKIYILENYQELNDLAADLVIKQIDEKPHSVIGLATGATPLGLYERLREAYKKGDVSFAKVQTFNLDEYLGLEKDATNSFYAYMKEQLFNHVDLKPENIHFPAVVDADIKAVVREYNDLLNAVTIDLQILGIGQNGHIGFNEPGTSFKQETHIATLSKMTRISNQGAFSAPEEVPEQALTMGIRNILKARTILLLINGKSKQAAVKRLLHGGISPAFPASALHKHPDVIVLITRDAYDFERVKGVNGR